VSVVQYTFTHKQYTEYRERNIHSRNNKKIKRTQQSKNFGKCGRCPVFASCALAFALQLRKKHGKPSVRAAARTSQADTVQYKNNEQYNTQKKNSNAEQYNVTEQ
jgi:aspartate-semialdehyde dehydrogenase